MADFAELIVPPTADEIEARLLALAELASLPTTSWVAGSVVRTIIAILSELLEDVFYAIAKLARAGIISTSTGAWLILLLRSQYDEALTPPVRTVGRLMLTDNGSGPHTITVGTHRFSTSGRELVYVVTALPNGATLALNDTLEVEIGAEGMGAAYNVPNGSIDTLVTSLPTVTCSNDAVGTTGTWITTLGADVESDAAAQTRAPLKWATLSTGSPPAAYLYWALSTTGVTRAKVDDGNPDGPNTSRVYIDNAGSVAALQATLDSKVPSGSVSTATLATSQVVTIPAVITIESAFRDTAAAAILANLTALALAIDIGGIVRKAEITEQIMSPDGVVDVEIGSAWAGAPNIQLTGTAIPSFTLSFTYTEV